MSTGKRARLAALLLCGASAVTLAAASQATPLADKPADAAPTASPADSVSKGVGEAAGVPAGDAGANTIANFLGSYLGQDVLPSVKITPDGDGYRVAFDIGTAASMLKSAGVVYEPATVAFKAAEQADGEWRADLAGMPPIVAHVTPPPGPNAPPKMDARVETSNLNYFIAFDPKLNWLSKSAGAADKMSVVEHGPGVEESFEIGGIKFDAATTSGANGLTMTIHEPLETLNFVMDVDPKGVDAASGKPSQPVHVSAQGSKGAAEIALSDFQSGPLADALKFFANHNDRAAMARDADQLKALLAALAADHMRLDERATLDKLDVLTQVGAISIEGATVGVGAVNGGADTGFGESFAARAIKLPDGLVPPMYAPMVPTSFDVAFKAYGFDLEAAAKEYIADLKLEGDGPVLSAEDQNKIGEKLMKGRPIQIDIPPSHVRGPVLDVAFEGKITIDATSPTGAITVTMRDFDKTAEAVQGLGPQSAQATPVIAMAKGLAKQNADGSLVWVCTVGADKIMKVNGMPLGKAPF